LGKEGIEVMEKGDTKKVIYCPLCKRKMFEVREGFGLAVKKKCKNCKRLIVYTPNEKYPLVKPVPPRNTSSGAIFW
jgi:transposase-like protein